MNHDARSYNSPLRQQQAEATRSKILEALVELIATGGITDIDIPSVAATAGVSIPTVYRHFGDKQGLIQALGRYAAEKAGLGFSTLPAPSDPLSFIDLIPQMYQRVEDMEPSLRAAAATEVGAEYRRAVMPERLAVIENALAPIGSRLSTEEMANLRDVCLILNSSVVVHAFKDYLGYDAKRAAPIVSWAVRRLMGMEEKHEH